MVLRRTLYVSAVGTLRCDMRSVENFIYTSRHRIYAEPCEIHSKIAEILIVPSILLGVLLGMAYGPTMWSQPSGLNKPCPLLERRTCS